MSHSILILVLAIVFNALANILMKVGMARVGKPDEPLKLVQEAVKQPALLLGLVSFGLALFAYSYVLTKLNLSIAYPIMISMGLVIVIFASHFILNETITIAQIIGFVLIFGGVWLVAR